VLARKRAIETGKAYMKGSMKGNTMKWPPFMLTFALNKDM
jgi:hypothetical protein